MAIQSTPCKVDVTLNGVNYIGEGANFWYYNRSAISVAKMRPSGGPFRGGTPIQLSGVGFLDLGGAVQGAKCRFGDFVVPATIMSHDTARCVSPDPNAFNKTVPVWLTMDGYTDERSQKEHP